MIQILITDDEPLIRKSIHMMLEEQYLDKELTIHEATDGLDALKIISSIAIDIILTDIKMPACSGIELMQKLKDFPFTGKIIALSGFDDYALVREAMKLGCIDYLLKPIIREEFFSLMDNCFLEILHMRSYISKHQDEHVSDIRKLYEHQYMIDQLLAGSSVLPGQFHDDTICILILIDLPKKERVHIDYSKSSYYKLCNDYFTPLLRTQQSLIQGESNGFWIVLLPYASDDSYQLIQPFLAGYMNKGQHACCSNLFPLVQFQHAYAECSNRMDHIFYNLPKLPATAPEPFPYRQHFSDLEEAACALNFNSFSSTTHDLFLLLNYDKKPVSEIKKLLSDFVYQLMQKSTRYIKIIGQYRMSTNDIFLCINDSFCLSDLKKQLLSVFQLYMQQNTPVSINQENNYIHQARSYIEKNYFQDISLNDIASYLNLHPNYFSSVFKKSSGLTCMEYLRKIRIEKACSLIAHTNLKLHEVATKVGYHDNLHFNRAFHKETGLPPSEYRKLHK